jgi:hypothetical protein
MRDAETASCSAKFCGLRKPGVRRRNRGLDRGSAGVDQITCEYIDRLVNIEMRFGEGLPRGVTHRLYDAARAAQGDVPLTFQAAEGLRRALQRGDHVLVVTGAGSAPWLPRGETDGPPGAAAIARALELGLGAKPIYVSEERNMGPVIASSEGIGLGVMAEADFARRDGVAMASVFPLGREAGASEAARLFEHFAPKAVVFVEKAGPNSAGIFHSILGTGRNDDMMANAQEIAREAQARGVFTLGIGDGGNEIGFGRVAEAVRGIQPAGRVCKCPCGQGVATVTGTDVLLSAAVSNWGAYGVAAALAALERRPEILHSADDEDRMLLACVAAGGFDGAYARQVPMVDGTSQRVQTSLITMLHEVVRNSLVSYRRGF